MQTPAASLLQTGLSLLLVLALIVACAWLLKRSRRTRHSDASLMKVRAQVMVGARERVILIEVGDQWIVTGVGGGQVRPLAVLPRPPGAEHNDNPPSTPAAFPALLSRFLDKP